MKEFIPDFILPLHDIFVRNAFIGRKEGEVNIEITLHPDVVFIKCSV